MDAVDPYATGPAPPLLHLRRLHRSSRALPLPAADRQTRVAGQGSKTAAERRYFGQLEPQLGPNTGRIDPPGQRSPQHGPRRGQRSPALTIFSASIPNVFPRVDPPRMISVSAESFSFCDFQFFLFVSLILREFSTAVDDRCRLSSARILCAAFKRRFLPSALPLASRRLWPAPSPLARPPVRPRLRSRAPFLWDSRILIKFKDRKILHFCYHCVLVPWFLPHPHDSFWTRWWFLTRLGRLFISCRYFVPLSLSTYLKSKTFIPRLLSFLFWLV